VGAIAGLPDAVQKLLAGHTDAGGFPPGLFGDDDRYRTFSGLPCSLAKALRKAAEQDAGPDPSWSTLAFLLEEEQFVQIANYLLVATNAVEYSLADEVDSVLPLVQDHRYAAYIDSYRYNSRRDVSELQKVMGDLQFEDPRMNTCRMFFRSWNVLDSAGNSIGKAGFRDAHRGFTLPALMEYCGNAAGAVRWEPAFMQEVADDFRGVMPDSDLGVRLTMWFADRVSIEQLKEWEGQLKEDPLGFLRLGDRFDQLNDRDSAIRCYDKSHELAPSCGTTTKVAKYHLDHGDFTKWEQMLLQFLQTEDRGLEHATVQAALAGGYALHGMWRKAKPHAVAAGQTASSWGMKQASYVTEALGEWEESEEWMRGSATAYASVDGYSWYLWCRRTGRGDVKSAEKFAAEFFKVPLGIPQKLGGPVTQLSRNDLVLLGGYHLLQGDRDRALETYRKALAFYPSFTCAFMVSQLSREKGDGAGSAETLAMMKEAATAEVRGEDALTPEAVAAGLAVMELMTTGDASDQRLAHIDALLGKLEEGARCAFAFFVAKELERLEKTDLAEQYWRRSLVMPAYDPTYATLSGVELAKRHGTSRPDDDELDEDDLWPPKPREQQERP
jgi:tetratricopeptide (TPR) repeat protein